MKNLLNSVKDSFIPSTTKIIDNTADTIKDTTEKALSFGTGGLLTKIGEVYKNSDSSKGFAFEHTHEATFNANSVLSGKPYEAIRIPPGGIKEINEAYDLNLPTERLGEYDLIIINKETNEILQTIQAKSGDIQYVKNSVADPKYENTDKILINSDNQQIADNHENVSTYLEMDGVTSIPVSDSMSKAIAENPELAAEIVTSVANGSEILAGIGMGGAISACLTSIQSSIKILGKFYRKEKVDEDILKQALKEVFEAIKVGALRGALVKILQIIIDSGKNDNSNLAVIAISIGMETYPVILKYFNNEIEFDEMVKLVGSKALSNGIIVTICMTYPPIGIGILSYSTINTVWKEFNLSEQLNKYIPQSSYLLYTKRNINKAMKTVNDTISSSKNKTVQFASDSKIILNEMSSKTINTVNQTIIDSKNKSIQITTNSKLTILEIANKAKYNIANQTLQISIKTKENLYREKHFRKDN